MNGLVLKNVNFIGFGALPVRKGMDVAINSAGYVEQVGYALAPEDCALVIDVAGLLLSPGWIDMHTHVYYGVSNLSIDPDWIGPATGVSALVDAGSSGNLNYLGFREYIIKKKNYPIYSFINLAATGLMHVNQISELDTADKLDLDGLAECISQNRDTIKGIKLRASSMVLRGLGIEIVRLAKRTAEEMELPLMVHISEPPLMFEDILPVLGEGDIVTHTYTGKKWGILKKDRLIPEYLDALERGIHFDLGHGMGNFNYEVAERIISLGQKPFTIGTDLHRWSYDGPVWDMPTTLSKILNVGLSLDDTIKGVTLNPATILGMESFQNGLVGKMARFTLFAVRDQAIRACDTDQNERILRPLVWPEYTIVGSTCTKASSRFGGEIMK